MFRRANRTRLDRLLAAIEIPAIGIWLGALCGFAFLFAPNAFHLVTDVTQFANLTAATLRQLAIVGWVCGGIGIVIALIRSRDASDRTIDIVRAALILVALLLVAYETFAVVPAMAAMTDLHSAAFDDLHQQSTRLYRRRGRVGIGSPRHGRRSRRRVATGHDVPRRVSSPTSSDGQR